MRKLIQVSQEFLVQCDYQNCGYKVMNLTQDATADSTEYIDKPCPRCGHVLLTQSDYDQYQLAIRLVNVLNRWFSWLTLFMPSKASTTTAVHIHKGIHIKDKA